MRLVNWVCHSQVTPNLVVNIATSCRAVAALQVWRPFSWATKLDQTYLFRMGHLRRLHTMAACVASAKPLHVSTWHGTAVYLAIALPQDKHAVVCVISIRPGAAIASARLPRSCSGIWAAGSAFCKIFLTSRGEGCNIRFAPVDYTSCLLYIHRKKTHHTYHLEIWQKSLKQLLKRWFLLLCYSQHRSMCSLSAEPKRVWWPVRFWWSCLHIPAWMAKMLQHMCACVCVSASKFIWYYG